jgi:hypothetical protein
LVIESDNLMPNVLEIGNDAHYRFGRKTTSSKRSQKVMISASQIQCDLRDISYYVKRKQGFPSITDIGVMDVLLGGEGFGFKLQLSTAEKHDRAQFFKVDTVKVNVKHLNIKLKQSKHKALFGLFKPLLLKVLKPVIVKVLEQQISHTFSDLDAFCYRVYQEEPHAHRRNVKDRDTSADGHSRDSGYLGQEGISGYGTGNTGYGSNNTQNPVLLNKGNEEPYERYTTATNPTPYGIA